MIFEPAVKKQFLERFREMGSLNFFQFLLVSAMKDLVEMEKETHVGAFPNAKLMNMHDEFLKIHRKEGEETFLEMAKVCRKAAHKVYRLMLKKNMIEKDRKFLTLV